MVSEIRPPRRGRFRQGRYLYKWVHKCHGVLMDFSHVELSEEDLAFRDELRAFLARIVTDEG